MRGEIVQLTSWKNQAETLFFIEKKQIKEISSLTNVSIRSISKHLNTLPHYAKEVERRKATNQDRREYFRKNKRKNRASKSHLAITGESLRREHEQAVRVLSSEKFY